MINLYYIFKIIEIGEGKLGYHALCDLNFLKGIPYLELIAAANNSQNDSVQKCL